MSAPDRWALVLAGPALVVIWVVLDPPDQFLLLAIPVAGLFAIRNLIVTRRRSR